MYKLTECVNLTSDLLVSDCNVAHPHYTYAQQDGSDDLLQFTVTPRSNVDNSVNGISATRKGVMLNYSQNYSFMQFAELNLCMRSVFSMQKSI